MITFGEKQIYLCCGKTDMRKSINSLSMMVSEVFSLNPFDEAVFVFCNSTRNRIKILEWDGDGFWLYFKCLTHGNFKWPGDDGSGAMPLTTKEFECLINGAKLTNKLRRIKMPARFVV